MVGGCSAHRTGAMLDADFGELLPSTASVNEDKKGRSS